MKATLFCDMMELSGKNERVVGLLGLMFGDSPCKAGACKGRHDHKEKVEFVFWLLMLVKKIIRTRAMFYFLQSIPEKTF